ncbi:MAG: alkaline phosphatase [Planctomycetota bacterium]|nr:MAG: alkaline phosphatase [Planctomycetota bacterium]
MLRCLIALTALTCTLSAQVSLQRLGSYESGVFDESAAEIAAYHAPTERLYVVNGDLNGLDVISLADPTAPGLLFHVDLSALGSGVQSVAVSSRLRTVAVAVAADVSTDDGFVALLDLDGNLRNTLSVGALPDMLTFAPDNTTLLVANEGEPNDDYSIDPEGSVSIIDLSMGVASATQGNVQTVDFTSLNATVTGDLRVFGPNATVAQDLEPEYITTARGSNLCWVSLQENNALAIIDWTTATLLDVVSLGRKDHTLDGNGLDASDKDDAIHIANWPLQGLYMPDAIASVRTAAGIFILSANEGDAREYDTFEEEIEVEDADLDPTVFPNAAELQQDETLGSLAVSITGDIDGDGDLDRLESYGARSMSVWDAMGNLVWDSGDLFERIVAERFPEHFNSTNDDNDSFDNRSDNKGPEPEGVTVGQVFGKQVAFVGLERMGGIMLLDVSDPTDPIFLDYVLDRDFSGDPEAGTGGDLGPEGLVFVSAARSPNGHPLLIVSNEVSGNTAIYQVVETR